MLKFSVVFLDFSIFRILDDIEMFWLSISISWLDFLPGAGSKSIWRGISSLFKFCIPKVRFELPACARTAAIHLNFYENGFQIIISRYCHLILSLGFDLYGIRKSRWTQIFYVICHILEDKFISCSRGHRSNPDIRESIKISFEYEDFLFWNENLNIELWLSEKFNRSWKINLFCAGTHLIRQPAQRQICPTRPNPNPEKN